MIDLIVGLIVLAFFTPSEEETPSTKNNDEMIRPILMEDFNDYEDFGE